MHNKVYRYDFDGSSQHRKKQPDYNQQIIFNFPFTKICKESRKNSQKSADEDNMWNQKRIQIIRYFRKLQNTAEQQIQNCNPLYDTEIFLIAPVLHTIHIEEYRNRTQHNYYEA